MATFKITNNKSGEINYFNADEKQFMGLMSLDKKRNFSFSFAPKYMIKPISDVSKIRRMIWREHIDSMDVISINKEVIPVEKCFSLEVVDSGVVAKYNSPGTTLEMCHTEACQELKALYNLMSKSELATYYGRRNEILFKNMKFVNENYNSIKDVVFSKQENNIIKTSTLLK